MGLIRISSQNMRSAYFLNDWSQRYTVNASFSPEYGYFSVPFMGNTMLDFGSNSGLSNYVYPYNNELVTFLHPSVNGQSFIDKLEPNTFFRQGVDLNLLSFGFYTGDSFWSFGCNLKENLYVNLPIDLFRLMKLGFETHSNVFDLKNINISQSNFAEISLGYSRPIGSKVRVGMNLKFLFGLSAERINYSRFDITLADDLYELNTKGEMHLMSSFVEMETNEDNYFSLLNYKFNFSNLKPAGKGMAFDVGVTYNPTTKLTLAAALNNVGYIKWDEKFIKRGTAQNNIQFSGFSNVSIDSIDIDSQLAQLTDDINKLIMFEEKPAIGGITEYIPTNINVSAEYNIFGNEKHDISIGLLWSNYASGKSRTNELTTAITLKPFSWLAFSGTYALLRKDASKLGLAMNFSPHGFNFFIASDFITTRFNRQFLPIDKFEFNLQTGISFNFGSY